MNIEPVTVQKTKRWPWALAQTSLNSIFAQLTFGGPVLVLLVYRIGLTKANIGLLLSFFTLSSLLVVVAGSRVARIGYKRIFLTFSTARILVLSALLFIPMLLPHYGLPVMALFATLDILVFAVLRSISETGYNPWFQEFVPANMRERFSVLMGAATHISGVLALGMAGVILTQSEDLEHYMTLLGIGLALGLLSVVCAYFIPGGAPVTTSGPTLHLDDVLDTLTNHSFVVYLGALALITLGSAPLSFVPLLLIERVGFTATTVIELGAVTMLGILASSYIWEWAANHWGVKPVTLLGLLTVALVPIAWLLVGRESLTGIWFAGIVAFMSGLASAGWPVGLVRLLFSRVVPEEKKTDYLSIHYAWAGLIGGVGVLATGALLDMLHSTGLPFTHTPGEYTPVFIGAFLLSLCSVFFIHPLLTSQSRSTKNRLRLLVLISPIHAVRSLIRYRTARAEKERISVTEQMGQARSPFIVDDLLDALADPSFNVRHEAIMAIGRMAPSERLYNALVEVLFGNEPDLSISAVWALGRLGDQRAIGPLREVLGSRYALLRARSARALATLGDFDILPLLVERFKSETDDGVRIAYASAFGSLHYRDAVTLLLPFLNTMRGKDSRMELALALARLAGESDQFVVMVRQVRSQMAQSLIRSVSTVKRLRMSHTLDGTFAACCDDCIMACESGDMDRAARSLADALEQLPLDDLLPIHAAILRECIHWLRETGMARMEYLLLAVHTATVALTT